MLYLSGKRVEGVPTMITPNIGYKIAPDAVWAADTGCFSASSTYSDQRYLAWLDRMPREGCLFATAPDVFGDGPATLELALPMLPKLRELGYRAALVVQPWITADQVPWDAIDVLFVGGPNEWQHSEQLVGLVSEAKRRGKWVHMGRVNTRKRLRYAASIGCDSADGTVLRFDPNRPIVEWARELASSPSLWIDHDAKDAEAEERFLKPINPDPVTKAAKELKRGR